MKHLETVNAPARPGVPLYTWLLGFAPKWEKKQRTQPKIILVDCNKRVLGQQIFTTPTETQTSMYIYVYVKGCYTHILAEVIQPMPTYRLANKPVYIVSQLGINIIDL